MRDLKGMKERGRCFGGFRLSVFSLPLCFVGPSKSRRKSRKSKDATTSTTETETDPVLVPAVDTPVENDRRPKYTAEQVRQKLELDKDLPSWQQQQITKEEALVSEETQRLRPASASY